MAIIRPEVTNNNQEPETSTGLQGLNEVALYQIVQSSDGKTYFDLNAGRIAVASGGVTTVVIQA